MKYHIVIEPTAKPDMDESYSLGVSVWGTWRAQKRVNRLLGAIRSLSDFPERRPLAPENDAFSDEVRQLLFHRYRGLYTIRENTVHVLHVRGAYAGTAGARRRKIEEVRHRNSPRDWNAAGSRRREFNPPRIVSTNC